MSGARSSRPLQSPAGGCRAFTLVEVMVAVTLAVLVLAAVYATFRGVFGASRRAESVAEVSQGARIILSRFAEDLSNLYPASLPVPSEEQGRSSPVFSLGLLGRKDPDAPETAKSGRVSFVTLSPISEVEGRGGMGLARVSYFRAGDGTGSPDERGSLLVREIEPLLAGASDRTQAERVLLSAEVVGLEFEFLDPASQAWQGVWSDAGGPPTAVAIHLALRSGERKGSRFTFSRVVPLPRIVPYSRLPHSEAPLPIAAPAR